MLAVCLLLALCVPVFAYTFSFTFTKGQPAVRNTSQFLSTAAPYVQHRGYTAETTYTLQVQVGSSVNVNTDPMASDAVWYDSDRTKKYFTYKSGYGGAGQKYYMVGFPSHPDFSTYISEGNWSP